MISDCKKSITYDTIVRDIEERQEGNFDFVKRQKHCPLQFHREPLQKITHVNYEWPKTARHGREWKLKRKTSRHTTETGIEFKYILNSEPLALTERNNRIRMFKMWTLFDLIHVFHPFNGQHLRGTRRDATKWIIFFECSIFEKQFCESFFRLTYLTFFLYGQCVLSCLPLQSIRKTMWCKSISLTRCRSVKLGGFSKRGNKTLTRTGCDWIKEGWLYSRGAIWKLTSGICLGCGFVLFVALSVNVFSFEFEYRCHLWIRRVLLLYKGFYCAIFYLFG